MPSNKDKESGSEADDDKLKKKKKEASDAESDKGSDKKKNKKKKKSDEKSDEKSDKGSGDESDKKNKKKKKPSKGSEDESDKGSDKKKKKNKKPDAESDKDPDDESDGKKKKSKKDYKSQGGAVQTEFLEVDWKDFEIKYFKVEEPKEVKINGKPINQLLGNCTYKGQKFYVVTPWIPLIGKRAGIPTYHERYNPTETTRFQLLLPYDESIPEVKQFKEKVIIPINEYMESKKIKKMCCAGKPQDKVNSIPVLKTPGEGDEEAEDNKPLKKDNASDKPKIPAHQFTKCIFNKDFKASNNSSKKSNDSSPSNPILKLIVLKQIYDEKKGKTREKVIYPKRIDELTNHLKDPEKHPQLIPYGCSVKPLLEFANSYRSTTRIGTPPDKKYISGLKIKIPIIRVKLRDGFAKMRYPKTIMDEINVKYEKSDDDKKSKKKKKNNSDNENSDDDNKSKKKKKNNSDKENSDDNKSKKKKKNNSDKENSDDNKSKKKKKNNSDKENSDDDNKSKKKSNNSDKENSDDNEKDKPKKKKTNDSDRESGKSDSEKDKSKKKKKAKDSDRESGKDD